MWTHEEQTVIPLNKVKILLMLAGALLFVALGFWFVFDRSIVENGHSRNLLITVIGSASILFFGICTYYLIRKLGDKEPGLVIDHTGLLDNSSAASAGYILWDDIESISVPNLSKQKMILLHVRHPRQHIDRQTGYLARKGMELTHRVYGTPVCITAHALSISFEELRALIVNGFEERKARVQC